MSVNAGNKFTRHMKRAELVVFVAAGRAEATFTAKSNKFQATTMKASVHGAAMRRMPAMNHLVDVFNDGRTRMKLINDMFIIVGKNGL